MANLGTTFDATSIEPAKALEVLPPGKYPAQIVNSEMRVTKDGMGQYLWLEIDVLDGPYKGRKLFDRLNLVNANPQTVEIAQRTLSAICHATGRMQVQDSEELHLIPFIADVQVQPPKNGYGESNKVRYLPLDAGAEAGRAAAAPRTASAPAPQAQPAAPQPAGLHLGALEAPGVRSANSDTAAGTSAKHERRRCPAQDIAETPMDSTPCIPATCQRRAARRAPGLPPSTTTSPRSARRSPPTICSGRRTASRSTRAGSTAPRPRCATCSASGPSWSQHMATLPKARDALKDQVIAVLRERHDEASWADVMDEAHRRLDGEAP